MKINYIKEEGVNIADVLYDIGSEEEFGLVGEEMMKFANREGKGLMNYGVMGKMSRMEFEDKYVWIGDTGASAHMTNMYNGFCFIRDSDATANFARSAEIFGWSGSKNDLLLGEFFK